MYRYQVNRELFLKEYAAQFQARNPGNMIDFYPNKLMKFHDEILVVADVQAGGEDTSEVSDVNGKLLLSSVFG